MGREPKVQSVIQEEDGRHLRTRLFGGHLGEVAEHLSELAATVDLGGDAMEPGDLDRKPADVIVVEMSLPVQATASPRRRSTGGAFRAGGPLAPQLSPSGGGDGLSSARAQDAHSRCSSLCYSRPDS